MNRPPKSQWHFGELFPMEATRRVSSVSELTTQIKRLLEKQVGQIRVSGEITNLRAQASSDLINWAQIGNATELGNGTFIFEGAKTAQFVCSFYRAFQFP